MNKRQLDVPTLTKEDLAGLLPPDINFSGLNRLFGHLAPAYLQHIAMAMETYTWFRYVESESKSFILKKLATRYLYRMLDRKDNPNFCAGDENAFLAGSDATGLTSRGVNYKPVNEDGIGIFQNEADLTLVCCDGVGDCLAGEIASYVILDEFDRFPGASHHETFLSSCKRLEALAKELSEEVEEFMTFPNEISQAAVTAVRITGDVAEISQVGDVLLFLLRDGRLSMLNPERRWLNIDELTKLFSNERYLSQRHIINNAVGKNYDPLWSPVTHHLKSGDLLVLASDGLETLHPKEMEGILNLGENTQDLLMQLYNTAIEANLQWGTIKAPPYTKPDNVSMILYRHE